MKTRIGINGFGRIGRLAARIIFDTDELMLTAINSPADATSHEYLLQYDSVYGLWDKNLHSTPSGLTINRTRIQCYQNAKPHDIPWERTRTNIVLECSGKFKTSITAKKHVRKSVSHVVISAPTQDNTPTIVLGVNEDTLDLERYKVISASSCTTNCVANVVKVLDQAFGIVRGMMTTTHAVTDTQNLLDNSHKKHVRLRRSALVNLIPTATGSARDVIKLLPQLKNRFICRSIRVPAATVSLADIVVEVKQKVKPDAVNNAFVWAAQNQAKGIINVASDELVSSDYVGSPYSAIIDPFLTDVIDSTLVHVVAWYDNEWGYAKRLVDLTRLIAKGIS